MRRDPVVQEVRAIREAYGERFHYDLNAIQRDLQQLERQSGRLVVRPQVYRPASDELVVTRPDDA